MANEQLVRAWKDEEYRLGLGEAERAVLPENPAGSLELTDAELDRVTGGLLGVFGIRIKINCAITVIWCGGVGSVICDGQSVSVEWGR